MEILGKTDIAVLVIDASAGLTGEDRELAEMFEARKIPYIIACNKSDKLNPADTIPAGNSIYVSALTGEGVDALKERISALADKDAKPEHHLVADLLSSGDQIVLVIPIDESAPKGRIILPQQQVIRDALEAGALITVSRETELAAALAALKEAPALVITDSQAFSQVAEIVPENVPLTSFSILMARYKGFLDTALSGVSMIETLKDGDKVLIAEGCTHHRQCRDIGTVKIPGWLKTHSGHDVTIETWLTVSMSKI